MRGPTRSTAHLPRAGARRVRTKGRSGGSASSLLQSTHRARFTFEGGREMRCRRCGKELPKHARESGDEYCSRVCLEHDLFPGRIPMSDDLKRYFVHGGRGRKGVREVRKR